MLSQVVPELGAQTASLKQILIAEYKNLKDMLFKYT